MNQNRASTRFRIIVFVLTICMTAFAFIHSSMPASVSGEESKSVLDFSGVLTGAIIMFLIYALYRRIKNIK